jgi:hypothetical protein
MSVRQVLLPAGFEPALLPIFSHLLSNLSKSIERAVSLTGLDEGSVRLYV